MPKEAGLITLSDPGSDRPLAEVATHQCCHCGGHFAMKPKLLVAAPLTPAEAAVRQKEGKSVRGFCQNCNGFVCGPGCAACVHVEQLLENIEKGRPLDYKPIVVPVTRPE